MDRNFNRAVNATLKYEGGYVNHPSDPGGATNLGVTIANFRRYVKPNGTIADLKALTVDQAKAVYRRQYWDAVSGAELPDGVDFAVFDFGVNSGPDRAIKRLQKLAGVAQDGRIGPATLKAVRAIPHAKLINDYQDERLAFVRGLRTFGTFGKGWTRRILEVRSLALSMTAAPVPKPTIPELMSKEPQIIDTKPAHVDPVKKSWLAALIAIIKSMFKRK